MLGYCSGRYRLWLPNEEKVIKSRDVHFEENIMEFKNIEGNNSEAVKFDEQREILLRNDEQENEIINIQNEQESENQNPMRAIQKKKTKRNQVELL